MLKPFSLIACRRWCQAKIGSVCVCWVLPLDAPSFRRRCVGGAAPRAYAPFAKTITVRRVRGRRDCCKASGVSQRGALPGADLGCSSRYSNENFEGRSGAGFRVNSNSTRLSRSLDTGKSPNISAGSAREMRVDCARCSRGSLLGTKEIGLRLSGCGSFLFYQENTIPCCFVCFSLLSPYTGFVARELGQTFQGQSTER